MLRRLWALIRVEFLNEFSSPVSLVFFLVLPLVFTAAVGAGLKSSMDPSGAPPEEMWVRLYVARADRGTLADSLLGALRGVNLDPVEVDALPEGEFGLEIPADFSQRLLDGGEVTVTLHTRPDSSASPAVEQAVMAARGRVGGAALVARAGLAQAREAGAVDSPEAEAAFFREVLQDTLDATADPPAVVRVRWPEGVSIQDERDLATSAEQASAGQLVTWVQITLLGAAEVLVSERLGGTLRRMLVVPTSRATILIGKLLARLALGLVQMSILLFGGAVLFKVNWGRDLAAVALVSLAFALATVSLGVLLATLVRTQRQAGSLVVGLSMTMAAMGGAWFPLEVTPQVYRQVVQVLPATWAMRAYTALLVRNVGLAGVLPQIGVLLAFAAVFLAAGVARFGRYSGSD